MPPLGSLCQAAVRQQVRTSPQASSYPAKVKARCPNHGISWASPCAAFTTTTSHKNTSARTTSPPDSTASRNPVPGNSEKHANSPLMQPASTTAAIVKRTDCHEWNRTKRLALSEGKTRKATAGSSAKYASAPRNASRVVAACKSEGNESPPACTARPQPGQNALTSGIWAEQCGQIMRASGMILGIHACAKPSLANNRIECDRNSTPSVCHQWQRDLQSTLS